MGSGVCRGHRWMILPRRGRWISRIGRRAVLAAVGADCFTPSRKTGGTHDDADHALGESADGDGEFSTCGGENRVEDRAELIGELAVEVEEAHSPFRISDGAHEHFGVEDVEALIDVDRGQCFEKKILHEEMAVSIIISRCWGLGVFPQEYALAKTLDEVGVFGFGKNSQQ